MNHDPAPLDEYDEAGVLSPQHGGSSILGLTPADDPADRFFREDARRLGLSMTEYEARFGIGIRNGPREERIEYNEVDAGMTDDDFEAATLAERHTTPERLHKRRHGRTTTRRVLAP